MEALSNFFNIIGSIFCHQLPERTIQVNGIPLPFCARDTGIYLGISAGMVFIMIKGRMDADRPPRLTFALVLSMMMVPMLVDGISSYIGLRSSTNSIRLFTGGFFGIGLPFYLIPAANFKVYCHNSKKILASWGELIAIAVSIAVLCVLILYTSIIPWIILSGILVAAFLFFIFRIVYTVVVRINLIPKKHILLAALGISVILLIIMYAVSTSVLQPIKYTITGY